MRAQNDGRALAANAGLLGLLDSFEFACAEAEQTAHFGTPRSRRKTREERDRIKAQLVGMVRQLAARQDHPETIGLRAQLLAIDEQIARFQRVDWDDWERDDPFEAQKGWRQYQQLQQARGVTAGKLTRAAQGMEAAGADETREAGLGPKGDSPVAEGDAPNPSSGGSHDL